MKSNFYLRLALGNIRKNGKFYIPFLLTCTAAAALFFDMYSLRMNESVIRESRDTQLLLQLGLIVVALFSVIFLFYTNSFLIKRRQKELALYNIFGMEKRHIARMLAWETFLSAVISIGAGIVLGIVFDRLMFLIIARLIRLDSVDYSLSLQPAVMTLLLFGAIFVLILVSGIVKITKSRPMELLRGSEAGEREPKSRFLLAVIGAALLAAGYGLAVSQRGISALTMFFVAVVLVILGTYCLFTAGTIAILKLLRKNRNFYYKPNHFISVSGMIYRMKQNAVGLANICILSTVVLVILSSTVSMYIGMNNVIDNRFACDIQGNAVYTSAGGKYDGQTETVAENTKAEVYDIAADMGLEVSDYAFYRDLSVMLMCDGQNRFTAEGAEDAKLDDVAVFNFIPADSWRDLTGNRTELDDDEILVFNGSSADSPSMKSKDRLQEGDTVEILDGEYRVKEVLEECPVSGNRAYVTDRAYWIVLSSEEALDRIDEAQRSAYTDNYSIVANHFQFNLSGTDEDELAYFEELKARMNADSYSSSDSDGDGYSEMQTYDGSMEDYPIRYTESRTESADGMYGVYGGFLFIGIFLGALFIAATVLIIYYKQLIEGYEDKERFEIMKKVGLSRSEIRSAVSSQILIMFFLPLVVAIVHLIFAFPMVRRILAMLSLTNVTLFMICTVIIVCIFAVCYAVIYAVTARAYYKIVS